MLNWEIGEEICKDLVESGDRLIKRTAEISACRILVPSTVEVASANVAYRECTLRAT